MHRNTCLFIIYLLIFMFLIMKFLTEFNLTRVFAMVKDKLTLAQEIVLLILVLSTDRSNGVIASVYELYIRFSSFCSAEAHPKRENVRLCIAKVYKMYVLKIQKSYPSVLVWLSYLLQQLLIAQAYVRSVLVLPNAAQ
ncbi:unnamed protein product [Litomosoides sigmodontis]|uniref:Uncharacterized protein n=1 Tax=Litomosoides sigmodontis TaxID=42156 RepID=A0A3P6SGK8_LITSI|nr:unnamed protein product [Litomosoides sigmodontis]